MAEKVAVLLDGGFVKKRLQPRKSDPFPKSSDLVALVAKLMSHDRLKDCVLYRAFYYDAPPFEGSVMPLSGTTKISYANTSQAIANRALLDALQFEPDFAVRRGTLLHHGWKLGPATARNLRKGKNKQANSLGMGDLVPHFEQKGVDIRVALDMASIALKRIVSSIVLVTGDSDFVPVMKFARTEGAKVYLHAMGQSVRPELKAHADLVL